MILPQFHVHQKYLDSFWNGKKMVKKKQVHKSPVYAEFKVEAPVSASQSVR